MNVLVTGSNGFIGKNLIYRLKELDNVNIIEFDKDTPFDIIEKNIDNIDFVFHLAGINRPKDVKEFYSGNADLTSKIVKLFIDNKKEVPILITSSIQAVLDND